MASEFEQTEDSDDAEELEYVCILNVRDMLLEEKVGVETDGCNIVNHVDRRLEEIAFVGTGNESETKDEKITFLSHFTI